MPFVYLDEYRLSTCFVGKIHTPKKIKNFVEASGVFYTEIIFVGLAKFLVFRDPLAFSFKKVQFFGVFRIQVKNVGKK